MKIIKKMKMPLRVIMNVAISLLLVILFSRSALSEESAYSRHEEGHENRHHLAFFLGNTHHEDEDGFSVGLDYEYRLNKILGIGGLVEYSGGDFDSWVVGVPVFIHPYKGLRLLVAPGFENRDSENKFLVRAGVAYQFEIGDRWAITPEYNLDFVHGETVQVYGISIGLGF